MYDNYQSTIPKKMLNFPKCNPMMGGTPPTHQNELFIFNSDAEASGYRKCVIFTKIS